MLLWTSFTNMNEKVCRACFALLKTKHYVTFDDATDVPGCETVKDALSQILPDLNYGVVIEPALCISCLMVIKATVKFRHTALNNEQKLLQYLDDMGTEEKVDLRRVIDREELTEVISSEHDYIRKYKCSRNLLTEEIKTDEVETFNVECSSEPNDEVLEFDVTDSIETFTEVSGDILKLFWGEDSLVPVKAERNDESTEQQANTDKDVKEDCKYLLDKQSANSDAGFNSTESCTYQEHEEDTDVKKLLEETEIEFPEADIEINENNKDTSDALDMQEVKEKNDREVILTCTKCILKIEGYNRAALHAQSKHGCERIICCKLCKKIFYTTRAYHVHNTVHGFKMGDVEARLPKKPVIKREAKMDPELCALCGLTFTRRVIFRNHMKRHEEGNPIECDLCMKPFYTNKQLKLHKIKHCRKNKIMDLKEFLCDFCGKYFDQYNKFYNHKKQHIKEGEFKCNQCEKVFTQRVKLRVHMRSHVTERPYMCDLCGHLSKYPEGMRKHRKKHFSAPVKVIRHRCPVCNKGFENLSRMKAHVVIHSNLQPFHCEICDRRFNLLNNLKRHMLVHTGERPYSCNFCSRSFTQKGALKLHQMSTNCRERMQSTNPNEVILNNQHYECNICGRKFKMFHWLKSHQKKHEQQDTSNSCDICGSTFANRGNLRRHLLCHTGEKPFQCKMCEKSFRQKTELVVHTRRHTGEKPYECELCGRGFVDLSEQRRHLRRHLRQVPADAEEEKVPIVISFE